MDNNSIQKIFQLNDVDKYSTIFKKNKKVQIQNILHDAFAEQLFKNAFLEKNWILSTGFNAIKYEKPTNKQFEKINSQQIKKIQNKFREDQFSYTFHRSMNNNQKSHFLEYIVRKCMSSQEFIDYLNQITDLNLTSLNTLFLSKYKSGHFLSPHSDKDNGKLAFVLNLSKFWKPQYGGVLHFLDKDRKEIIESFVPSFNNLILFEVPKEGIPHFVSHVAPSIKHNRYAITGWYS